ncbi:MAG: phenylacetate-CoA oxygenase subunit PaaJ [Gammaproteobacteria bacterium]|nr:phenylacetate-CoA oxygenase subunit PaaJ [Gammaproteobacteria bacterium]
MIVDSPVVSAAYEARRTQRETSKLPEIWMLLDQVCDPEIPVLSLWDLGVITAIEKSGERLEVTITPTYSGCPAMQTMRDDIEAVLTQAGIDAFEVRESLSPAWSSDWISPEGRGKLTAYGIAAPKSCDSCQGLALDSEIPCPHCGSADTRMTSEFGSTACKALFQCRSCQEPFDYFKPI